MLLDIMQFVTGAFVVVFEGQHAVKFTLGKAGEVVDPGIHFKWPIIQKFAVKCTRDTSLRIHEQTVQVAENLVYKFSATVIYKIVDLHKAMVEVSDLSDGLTNLVGAAIQRALRKRERKDILDTESISTDVIREIEEKTNSWGVRIIEFGFTDLAPTQETAKVIQTQLLSNERVSAYQDLITNKGLPPDVAAALVSGAAMIVSRKDSGLAAQ